MGDDVSSAVKQLQENQLSTLSTVKQLNENQERFQQSLAKFQSRLGAKTGTPLNTDNCRLDRSTFLGQLGGAGLSGILFFFMLFWFFWVVFYIVRRRRAAPSSSAKRESDDEVYGVRQDPLNQAER